MGGDIRGSDRCILPVSPQKGTFYTISILVEEAFVEVPWKKAHQVSPHKLSSRQQICTILKGGGGQTYFFTGNWPPGRQNFQTNSPSIPLISPQQLVRRPSLPLLLDPEAGFPSSSSSSSFSALSRRTETEGELQSLPLALLCFRRRLPSLPLFLLLGGPIFTPHFPESTSARKKE